MNQKMFGFVILLITGFCFSMEKQNPVISNNFSRSKVVSLATQAENVFLKNFSLIYDITGLERSLLNAKEKDVLYKLTLIDKSIPCLPSRTEEGVIKKLIENSAIVKDTITNVVEQYVEYLKHDAISDELKISAVKNYCLREAYSNINTKYKKVFILPYCKGFDYLAKTSVLLSEDGSKLYAFMALVDRAFFDLDDDFDDADDDDFDGTEQELYSINLREMFVVNRSIRLGSYRTKRELYDNKVECSIEVKKNAFLKESQLTNKFGFFSDRSFVVAFTWGGFQVIDINGNHQNDKLYVIDNSISALCCFCNDKIIAIGSHDGCIALYDLSKSISPAEAKENQRSFGDYFPTSKNKKQYRPKSFFLFKHSSAIKDMKSLPDNKCIVFCSGTKVYLLHCDFVKNKYELELIYDGNDIIESIDCKGNYIACESAIGNVVVIDIDKKRTVSFSGLSKIHSLSISSDKNNIAVGFDDGKVCIWNINTKMLVQEIQHKSPVYFVSYTADGKQLVVKTTKTIDNVDTYKKFSIYCHEKFNICYKDEVFIYPTENNIKEHMALLEEGLKVGKKAKEIV